MELTWIKCGSVRGRFNVPIAITTNKDDCPLSNCPFDLNQACPDSLKKKNDKGETVGCLTDCGATVSR